MVFGTNSTFMMPWIWRTRGITWGRTNEVPLTTSLALCSVRFRRLSVGITRVSFLLLQIGGIYFFIPTGKYNFSWNVWRLKFQTRKGLHYGHSQKMFWLFKFYESILKLAPEILPVRFTQRISDMGWNFNIIPIEIGESLNYAFLCSMVKAICLLLWRFCFRPIAYH